MASPISPQATGHGLCSNPDDCKTQIAAPVPPADWVEPTSRGSRIPVADIALDNGETISGEVLKPEDMTPSSYARYIQMAKAKNGPDSPPPLVLLDRSDSGASPRSVTGRTTLDNEFAIVINDKEFQWSAEYASTQMKSDQELADRLKHGPHRLVEARGLSPEVRALYEHIATAKDKMNLPYAPPIYTYANPIDEAKSDGSSMTREGSMYVVISPHSLAVLSPEELEGILGHELAHLKHGLSASVKANFHNKPALAVEEERNADKDGTGPLGTCRPGDLAQAFKVLTDIEMSVTGFPKEQYFSVVNSIDNVHPQMLSRIEELTDTAIHAQPGCSVNNTAKGQPGKQTQR